VDETNENASPRLITAKHPNIVVYESSMLNCYGLQQLHSFIALPYLSFKEREYLNRADNMRNGHRKWKDSLMQFDVVGYDEFARELNAETVSNSNMKDKQRRPQQGELLQSRLHESITNTVSITEKAKDHQLEGIGSAEQKTATKAMLSGQRGKTKTNSSEPSKCEDSSASESNHVDASSSIKEIPEPKIEELSGPPNVGPRKLFSSLHKPTATSNAWAPMDSTDDALDSFFADDEDLNDGQGTEQTGIHSSNSPKGKVEIFLNSDDSSDGNSSDDSEDDDFYIDNLGIRHAHSQLNHHATKLSRSETSASVMAGTISPNSEDDEQSTSYTKVGEKECEKDSDDERSKSLVEMKSGLRESSPTKSHDNLELQEDSLDAKNAQRPETPATIDVDERDKVSEQSEHDSQNQIFNGDSHDEVHCVAGGAKFMKEDCTEKCHLPLYSCDDGDASNVVSGYFGVHSSEAGNNDSSDSADSVTKSPQKNTPPAKNEKLELTDSTDISTTKHDNDDTLTTHESYNSSDLNVVTTKENSVDSTTNEESTPTLVHVNGSNHDLSLKAANSFEVNGVTERLQSTIESKSMEGDIDAESVPDQSQSADDGVVASNNSSSNFQNIKSSVHIEGAASSNNNNAVDNINDEVVPCNKSMVLNSDDDESVGSQKESFRDIKSKPHKAQVNDSDEDDEFIIDESVSSKPMRPESTPSNHNSDSTKRNEQNALQQQSAQPPKVSNAALAAIEAAKREAERMMAKPQIPSATSEVGKDRKDKKKSEKKKAKISSIGLDGEKKKKKKEKEKEKKKKEKKDGN